MNQKLKKIDKINQKLLKIDENGLKSRKSTKSMKTTEIDENR